MMKTVQSVETQVEVEEGRDQVVNIEKSKAKRNIRNQRVGVKKRVAESGSVMMRRREIIRKGNTKKRRKKKKCRSSSGSSDSDDDSDDSNVRRSAISGKKIKMHIDKTEDDLVREHARKEMLKFMNSSI